MSTEKTFVMVKPNGVARGPRRRHRGALRAPRPALCGSAGSCASTRIWPRTHYAEHVGKPFYPAAADVHHLGPGRRHGARGPRGDQGGTHDDGPDQPVRRPAGDDPRRLRARPAPPTSSTAPTDPRAPRVRSTSTSTTPTWSELQAGPRLALAAARGDPASARDPVPGAGQRRTPRRCRATTRRRWSSPTPSARPATSSATCATTPPRPGARRRHGRRRRRGGPRQARRRRRGEPAFCAAWPVARTRSTAVSA